MDHSLNQRGRIVHRSGLKNKKIKQKFLNLLSLSVTFICIWWIFKDIVENQDLYGKKDDLQKIYKQKFLLFDLKDL